MPIHDATKVSWTIFEYCNENRLENLSTTCFWSTFLLAAYEFAYFEWISRFENTFLRIIIEKLSVWSFINMKKMKLKTRIPRGSLS